MFYYSVLRKEIVHFVLFRKKLFENIFFRLLMKSGYYSFWGSECVCVYCFVVLNKPKKNWTVGIFHLFCYTNSSLTAYLTIILQAKLFGLTLEFWTKRNLKLSKIIVNMRTEFNLVNYIIVNRVKSETWIFST